MISNINTALGQILSVTSIRPYPFIGRLNRHHQARSFSAPIACPTLNARLRPANRTIGTAPCIRLVFRPARFFAVALALRVKKTGPKE